MPSRVYSERPTAVHADIDPTDADPTDARDTVVGQADTVLGDLVRREHGLVVAHVRRLVGDFERAEEIVQEAALRALQVWRAEGIPDRPGAWLLVVARRIALDLLRRQQRQRTDPYEDSLHGRSEAMSEHEHDEPASTVLRDDLLRLFFTCCHPLLSRDAQVALALRELAGLEAHAIAKTFLTSEATIAQRLVRAKRTLRERQIAYRVPTAWELPERLPAVLDVIYLVFNAGYSPAAGARVVESSLCDEAIRLGGLLVEVLPASAEAWGLLSLMELHAARAVTRTSSEGETILLEHQDRARWDRHLIARGLEALERSRHAEAPGSLVLQAEIAACHATADSFSETDWARIAALYATLEEIAPSPVVALNRAVAVGMAEGAEAGLRAIEALARDPRLARYAWLASAQGEFLERLGRHAEAAHHFRHAADLSDNSAERALLERRRRACEAGGAGTGTGDP